MEDSPLTELLRRQQGLATRRQLECAGLTRRRLDRAVADGRLVRLRTGLFSSGPLPPKGRHLLSGGRLDRGYLTQVRAALLTLGEEAAAARRTAALVHGFDLAVEPSTVEVDVGADRSRVALRGVDARRRPVKDTVEIVSEEGSDAIRVTSALTTVLDCACTLPLQQAVVVADSAMRIGAITHEQLIEAVAKRRSGRHGRRLMAVLRWCDPKSGSVLESLLRVLLARHGLLPPKTQLVLRNGKLFLCRVDFAWPDQLLIVEADGRLWHDPDDARNRDRRRDNATAALG